jgi:hypothetical protein
LYALEKRFKGFEPNLTVELRVGVKMELALGHDNLKAPVPVLGVLLVRPQDDLLHVSRKVNFGFLLIVLLFCTIELVENQVIEIEIEVPLVSIAEEYTRSLVDQFYHVPFKNALRFRVRLEQFWDRGTSVECF